ncbi:MAG: SH3 domain-containing protein [Crocosphaera sp.]
MEIDATSQSSSNIESNTNATLVEVGLDGRDPVSVYNKIGSTRRYRSSVVELGKLPAGGRVQILDEGRDEYNGEVWYQIYHPSSGIKGWVRHIWIIRDN